MQQDLLEKPERNVIQRSSVWVQVDDGFLKVAYECHQSEQADRRQEGGPFRTTYSGEK